LLALGSKETGMSRGEVLVLALLALVVVGSYSNTLRAPFVFDDYSSIVNNAAIRLTTFTLQDITQAGASVYRTSRPVAYMSLALNYYVHQYHVTGYHVVNLLIHLTAGLWLYLFVKTTLQLPGLPAQGAPPVWIASLTTLLWLVQPLHTESVTYIVQRMNSLAAMFYMLALLLYVRARLSPVPRRRWGLLAGCALAGLLALGSKEIALTLPAFLVLYEWYFFQDLSPRWGKRALLAMVGVGVLLALAVRMHMGPDAVHNIIFRARQFGSFDFTVMERVLTEWRVVLLYLRLLLVPHPSQLNLEHDFPLSHSLFDPLTTVVALGTILGILGLAVALARRERLLSFCIVWFFGNLVIESSVVMLDIVFEHRTYLPSMLLSLLVVLVVVRVLKHPWLCVGSLCAVALVYAVWTYERNTVWADLVTLWSDCVAKSPHKVRPHWNLAVELEHRGQIEAALQQYMAVVDAPRPDKMTEALAHASQAKVQVLMDQGDDEEGAMGASELEAAVRYYTSILRLAPNSAVNHYNLGRVLERQGKVAEAVHQYTEALRLKPQYAQVLKHLEWARRHLGAAAGPMHPDPQPSGASPK
jgi:hypothetical protein